MHTNTTATDRVRSAIISADTQTAPKWTTDQYGNSIRTYTYSDRERDMSTVTQEWRDTAREYNKERDIRNLMMNRHGVCG